MFLYYQNTWGLDTDQDLVNHVNTLKSSMDPVEENGGWRWGWERETNLFSANLFLRSLLGTPAGYSLVVGATLTSMGHI